MGYLYKKTTNFKINAIYEHTYLLNLFQFKNKLDCMVKCNALKDCLLVKIEEPKMCKIFNELAFLHMFPSNDIVLYEKIVNGYFEQRMILTKLKINIK